MHFCLEPRRSERPQVELAAIVGHPRTGRRFVAELVEISCEGCRVLTDQTCEPGDQVLVTIEGLEQWPARVIWAQDGAVGVEFHTPLQPAVVACYAAAFPARLRIYAASAPRPLPVPPTIPRAGA